jgi:hypothetical protein
MNPELRAQFEQEQWQELGRIARRLMTSWRHLQAVCGNLHTAGQDAGAEPLRQHVEELQRLYRALGKLASEHTDG